MTLVDIGGGILVDPGASEESIGCPFCDYRAKKAIRAKNTQPERAVDLYTDLKIHIRSTHVDRPFKARERPLEAAQTGAGVSGVSSSSNGA